MDEDSSEKKEIDKDFSNVGCTVANGLPTTKSEFGTLRGDWDGTATKKFATMVCPKWFGLEQDM